ncbi:hypothetical protein CN311_16105 [Mesorhizobium sanjuanii]|uniref:Uncharacterized protein n=1 Tax=Mesorhizobium sanjuanii TaxID=2037900 RepID=A0A2A6FF90_9HYPH|nr:hypothetical protein [Mesorhizobium sanjuanii]PDQ20088.1 hypothetical protein CN311_16105 [Mesorhizobium sanjuanii]
MTKNTEDVRLIQDPRHLLDWVIEQAIPIEPQLSVTKSLIEIVRKEVRDCGHCYQQAMKLEYNTETAGSA